MLERGKMDRGVIEIVGIDSLVPETHLLRQIDRAVDFIGTILTVYAAYKAAAEVKEVLTGSADDALRAGGTLADDVDGIVRNAGLTQAQIDDIIKTPKGQRPNPNTYLTQEYIDQHLDMFRGGVTKIYAKAPTGTVGPPEGTFVMPSSVADDLIMQVMQAKAMPEY